MTLDYYVYALLDSSKIGNYIYGEYNFDYEPFYIGKGKGKRIKNTLYDNSPFKKNKILKLKRNNIKVISIKLFDKLSNNEAIVKEKEIISIIGRRDLNKGPLVNTTDGGDGRLNSKHSKQVREKISKNRKGKAIGWKHSIETLKLMSENQSGEKNGFYGKKHNLMNKKLQSDRVSGLSHPMFGKTHSKKTIDYLIKHREENVSNEKIKESCQKFNKRVLMYSLDFNLINEFQSVKEASNQTNINESIISKCCRGDIKHPTRYFFRYKNSEDNLKKNKYLIDINDTFYIGKNIYKLVKRNKKTCICENNGNLETLHIKDVGILFKKETNNIDIVELYLYLKSLDKSFKIKENIIYNKNIEISYLKLLENSELFNKNNNYKSDIVIFEDEWINKKDIVKSRLKNSIGKSEKIFARKCEIKEIKNNKLVRSFLNENHIQGFVGSVIKLGLFYKDQLVSLMTFGNLRKTMGQKAKNGNYELLRFCNKLNTTVIGGASRLFKFFTNNYRPQVIISYADRRWSNGNLYYKLGFNFIDNTVKNYYWIINGNREYRFKWRKDKLVSLGYDPNKTEVEIMNSLNFFRIFDKGSMKFEWVNYSSL